MPEPSATRPAAVLVTRNFPPLVGGMERLNRHLLEELAVEWDVALCGPKGCGAHVPEGVEAREAPVRPLLLFLVVALWRAFVVRWRRAPRVVIAGSGLAAPLAWLVSRRYRARAVVYLHGLDIIAPSRIYQAIWLPFIRRCEVVFVNSENTARLARGNGVAPERIHVVHPGTRIPEAVVEAAPFNPSESSPVLLSVGRLTRRKGLAEFVERALPAIRASAPGVRLVVIGDDARNALHGAGGSERARIEAAAAAAGVGDAIQFVGHCSEATLDAALFAAQVHVFPVLDLPGDVEGFGMVAIEAAAHGLQTVAFAVGGIPDAISEPASGRLVPAGDYTAFAHAVVEALAASSRAETHKACREFAATLSWDRFGQRVRDELRRTPNGR